MIFFEEPIVLFQIHGTEFRTLKLQQITPEKLIYLKEILQSCILKKSIELVRLKFCLLVISSTAIHSLR